MPTVRAIWSSATWKVNQEEEEELLSSEEHSGSRPVRTRNTFGIVFVFFFLSNGPSWWRRRRGSSHESIGMAIVPGVSLESDTFSLAAKSKPYILEATSGLDNIF